MLNKCIMVMLLPPCHKVLFKFDFPILDRVERGTFNYLSSPTFLLLSPNPVDLLQEFRGRDSSLHINHVTVSSISESRHEDFLFLSLDLNSHYYNLSRG